MSPRLVEGSIGRYLALSHFRGGISPGQELGLFSTGLVVTSELSLSCSSLEKRE